MCLLQIQWNEKELRVAVQNKIWVLHFIYIWCLNCFLNVIPSPGLFYSVIHIYECFCKSNIHIVPWADVNFKSVFDLNWCWHLLFCFADGKRDIEQWLAEQLSTWYCSLDYWTYGRFWSFRPKQKPKKEKKKEKIDSRITKRLEGYKVLAGLLMV